MDPLEESGEDSKCGIVQQLLCMACLGPGQTLHVLKHQAMQLYNTTVNGGQQLVHNLSPRVCWECEILLNKVINFRERVTECHDILNSSHLTWSEVTRPSRLQKSTPTEIDIPPLDTECSMSEVKQEIEELEEREPSATEDTQSSEVKIEIEEHDPFEIKDIQPSEVKLEIEEVKEHDPLDTEATQPSEVKIEIVIEEHPLETKNILSEVKQEIELCTGCLCGGRRLNNIRDKELKYYTDILNQKMLMRDVLGVTPRLCWECCCMLRQAILFSEKSVESYQTLLPSILTADIQDITSLLCSGVSLPPRLRRCVRDPVDIPPHAHTHDPLPPVKLEPGSLGLGDSSPLPAGHVQRTDDPATEVKHKSRLDTAHVTTSKITSDRRHRECTSKQQLISNMYPHNTSVCEDNSHVCVESAVQDPRRRKQSAHKHYQCDHCSNTFKLKSLLIYHIRAHTAEKPYQCSQCTKAYASKQSLLCHMTTHSGQKPYQCSQCSKAYNYKHHLAQHMITHRGEKPYQCSQCSKAYYRKDILVNHMVTHSAEKPCQRSQCSKAYKYKHHLNQYMITHRCEKPYQCSQCTKAYSSKQSLLCHMTTHSGQKPYQCSQCSKAYNYKHHLNQHMITHSGVKPYQCSQCTKACTSKRSLVCHMTTHSGQKPYHCSQCSKAYNYKHHLNQHMITHSGVKPYQCSQCTKAYTSKRSLVCHMTTHSGQKPYQCSQCTKAYTSKRSLVCHIITHSGEKPYQCDQCSKAFYRKDVLVNHMATHRAEKPCRAVSVQKCIIEKTI